MIEDSGWAGWLVALGLLSGLLATSEAGFRCGLRHRQRFPSGEPDNLGSLQGAILGILALLLGFSFSSASSRFSDRVELILAESDAIKACWRAGDLLAPVARTGMREGLIQYVDARVAFYEAKGSAALEESVARSRALQGTIWSMVVPMARETPDLSGALLGPVSRIIELEARRTAAVHQTLPGLVLFLLISSSLVSVGAVNYGCGVAGRRSLVLNSALAFLVAALLWTIMDLDHPRRGIVRTGQQSLVELQRSLRTAPVPAEVGR